MANRMQPNIEKWSDTGNIVCLEGNGSRPSHKGDGWKQSEVMFTLNSTEVHAVCYGISSFCSNGMLSSNPHSGIYKADTSRTLDLNGGNPACNQGGIVVVEISDDREPSERLKGADKGRRDMSDLEQPDGNRGW